MSATPDDLKPGLPFSLVNKLDVLSKKMIPIEAVEFPQVIYLFFDSFIDFQFAISG